MMRYKRGIGDTMSEIVAYRATALIEPVPPQGRLQAAPSRLSSRAELGAHRRRFLDQPSGEMLEVCARERASHVRARAG
jgi:hypothetical protein